MGSRGKPSQPRGFARILAYTLAGLFIAGIGASAASATSHGEAAIRGLLDDLVLAFLSAGGAEVFRSSGGAQIVPAAGDAKYRVTFPATQAFLGADRIWDLDQVALDIADLGGDRFALSATLPPKTRLFDALGAPVADISIGAQTLRGTWNGAILAFDRVSGQLADLRYDATGGGASWHLGSLETRSISEHVSAARWRQRASAELRNMAVAGPVAGTSTRFARISGSYSADDIKLEELGQLLRTLWRDGETDSQSLLAEYAAVLTDRPDLLPDRVRMSLVLDGVASNALTPTDLTLRATDIDFELQGLTQSVGTMRFALIYEGLEVPAALAASFADPALAAALAPRDATVVTTSTNLPTQEIREAYLTVDPAVLEQETAANFVAAQRRILEAMNDARTRVTFDSVRLKSAALTVVGEGSVDIDLAAARGAVGTGHIVVRGLKELLGSLARQPSRNNFRALSVVGVMIALGEAIEDDTGPAHIFDVELTGAGKFLVNGQDLSLLFSDE